MNNEARQQLSKIINTYGTGICENKERCKKLLLDYCSGFEAEINVLIAALEINAVAELLNISTPVPTDMVINRIVQRLYNVKRLDKEAARWGIESTALALRKINARLESAQLTPVETLARTSKPLSGLPSQPLPVETRPLTSSIQPPRSLPTSIPPYGSDMEMAPQVNVPATGSHFLGNLFLPALSVVILVLGGRSEVFLFNQRFLLTLSAICVAAAMLGHKRGLLAVIIFFALGAIAAYDGPH